MSAGSADIQLQGSKLSIEIHPAVDLLVAWTSAIRAGVTPCR